MKMIQVWKLLKVTNSVWLATHCYSLNKRLVHPIMKVAQIKTSGTLLWVLCWSNDIQASVGLCCLRVFMLTRHSSLSLDVHWSVARMDGPHWRQVTPRSSGKCSWGQSRQFPPLRKMFHFLLPLSFSVSDSPLFPFMVSFFKTYSDSVEIAGK